MSEEATTDDVLLGSRPSLVSTRAAHLSPKLQRRGSSSARKFGYLCLNTCDQSVARESMSLHYHSLNSVWIPRPRVSSE
ncbi:hypothetical protein CRE_31142 [Caenorhabditis remanei]|uniref:Uncharacterized protein n=1 Tax=Caenorhabditis remanei TaxID=31234 RepID=E3LUV1_CAERE|nr:hypothetical protein CRE_31142 [Caenorhabditis remanei]